MDRAFTYAEKFGIEEETTYPYKGMDGECSHNEEDGKVKVTKYVMVTKNDPEALKKAVSTGPVSIAVEADHEVFQGYEGGIVNGDCGTDIDHGITIVGYGSTGKQNYWIVRNSWGASWGEEGYVRIENTGKKDEGMCGINTYAVYPVIA